MWNDLGLVLGGSEYGFSTPTVGQHHQLTHRALQAVWMVSAHRECLGKGSCCCCNDDDDDGEFKGPGVGREPCSGHSGKAALDLGVSVLSALLSQDLRLLPGYWGLWHAAGVRPGSTARGLATLQWLCGPEPGLRCLGLSFPSCTDTGWMSYCAVDFLG